MNWFCKSSGKGHSSMIKQVLGNQKVPDTPAPGGQLCEWLSSGSMALLPSWIDYSDWEESVSVRQPHTGFPGSPLYAFLGSTRHLGGGGGVILLTRSFIMIYTILTFRPIIYFMILFYGFMIWNASEGENSFAHKWLSTLYEDPLQYCSCN